jgi:hypothetical protein
LLTLTARTAGIVPKSHTRLPEPCACEILTIRTWNFCDENQKNRDPWVKLTDCTPKRRSLCSGEPRALIGVMHTLRPMEREEASAPHRAADASMRTPGGILGDGLKANVCGCESGSRSNTVRTDSEGLRYA